MLTYAALEIFCDVDERREYIRAWFEENRQDAVAAGCDVTNCPALKVTVTPCGEIAEYWAIEDIPLEDVPCSCGNPNHWFIKYRSNCDVER